ncbi:MAG TPA: adenylate/guanylate cyclase domain-containing protein [Candidatus Limnocylindria bacterium]|nr:adenylate/guanylate cyclase domain-containing protein [Candidatus Limnocylindria bacterium]
MNEPAVPIRTQPELASSDALQAGRDALARHQWQEAYELLDRADREGSLSGADLESLSEAAFFAAHADRESEVRERAFKAYLAEGNPLRAASVAMDLAHRHTMAGRHSISSAWMRRGERLLEGEAESYAHGYLALIRSDRARNAGDISIALEEAEEAVRIATRTGHADLHATALLELGSLKIATGATSEGFELMEEATVAAVNGELSPITTGVTCCRMIAACRDLTDYQRASEWTEATDRWCERQSVSGFPGVCRVHRAEVVAVSGAWERAERELRQATQELAAYNAIPPMADGFYATGEIRRLRGDLAGAESALREAHALGRSPQPALALIRLAEGKVKAAATAINSAVRDETWDQWARARLLPAQVEIAVASGDLALAREAAEELTRIVETYKSPAQEAGRHVAMGRLLLAEGDAPGAVQELRSAVRGWREVGAPYEVARGRALLARALLAVDDDDDAELELKAARDEFERLGAMPDLAASERDLRSAADREAAPVQTHKTFMFTDIVGSTNLAELLGNDSWERLLRWHDDALRALVATSRGEVVNSTGDGFFAAFDTARAGVECALAIQRALADHRRDTGFALSVRIGLHTAEANRRGADYSGMGVHVAARVAALAGGGEILATADTLAEAGHVATSELREATVKGVTAPIRVASVTWT